MYEISSKLARKIIIFSPINEWHAIAFASPHTFTNVGYVKNKGVVKFKGERTRWKEGVKTWES